MSCLSGGAVFRPQNRFMAVVCCVSWSLQLIAQNDTYSYSKYRQHIRHHFVSFTHKNRNQEEVEHCVGLGLERTFEGFLRVKTPWVVPSRFLHASGLHKTEALSFGPKNSYCKSAVQGFSDGYAEALMASNALNASKILVRLRGSAISTD